MDATLGLMGGKRGAKRPRSPPNNGFNFSRISSATFLERERCRACGERFSVSGERRPQNQELTQKSDAGGEHRALPSKNRRRRRRRLRLSSVVRRTAATAVALASLNLLSTATAAGLAPQASFDQKTGGPTGSGGSKKSFRLCSPAENTRAYVTTLASDSVNDSGGVGISGSSRGRRNGADGGGVLGPRVLAQSLRSAGAQADVIVLVPLDKATGSIVSSLRRDGLTVRIVPRGLQSAGGEIVSEELMTKVFLWSLTSYDRVVYLDPRSLIQKNPDALFACEGFCAAGAVPSSFATLSPEEEAAMAVAAAAAAADASSSTVGDDDDEEGVAESALVRETPLSVPPSWQPSTSVMVLEPSIDVHVAMLDELTQSEDVGSLKAQVFLSTFLGAAGEQCTPFDDLAGVTDRRSSIVGEEGNFFGPDDGFGGGADDGGGLLEDALMPVVLLNGAHMPRCSAGRQRTAEGVCQSLPYTYAAPSTDFDGKGRWRGAKKHCLTCREATDPHIIHFADEDTPWKRLAYLHKPLFWKWNTYREQLEYPYGNFFSPWVLFFIPCVVLAFARVYYKTTGTSSSRNGAADRSRPNGVCSSGAGLATSTDESPSKSRSHWFRSTRRQQRQVAILPTSGMATAYDSGGAMGLSIEASAMLRNSSGGAVGSEAPAGHSLPVAVCYLLSALVAAFAVVWFRATRSLALSMVDASWHPIISVAVYNAWLCCALVLGLNLIDYVYYALLTRGRTLLKDIAVVSFFVLGVCALHSVTEGGTAWAGAIGAAVVTLGVGHGSRAGASYHLSGRSHFRCITASCVVSTIGSLIMCYTGANAHRVASRRAHAAAAIAQMLFSALVYASVIGGARLWADMDEAGARLSRSRSTASVPGEDATAAQSTTEASGGRMVANASATEDRLCGRWTRGWLLLARAVVRTKNMMWRRRRVTACIAVLLLWKVSASLWPTTPGTRFEKYGQSCLESESGYVEAGVKRLARVCGAEQALRPMATGAYFEAFRQDKMCLEVAGGGFLTLGRVHVAQACTPENQFVFQQVSSSKSRAKAGTPDALSSAPAAGTPDDGEYCLYNPTSGFYLSAQNRPKAQCGQLEHWRVKAAPRAPGLKVNSAAGRAKTPWTVSKLVHPNFLSHGPLHTVYGYLLAATALLVARAVFAKLASWQSVDPASHTDGGSGASASGRHRYGSLHSRQRSHRRAHSRMSGNVDDVEYFADAGYAGDAEAGSAGHGAHAVGTRVRPSSLQPFACSGTDHGGGVSLSPVVGPQRTHMAWGADAMIAGREKGVGEDGQIGFSVGRTSRLPRTFSDRSSKEMSASASSLGADKSGRGNALVTKVFTGLCLACDATLLAGLWCLVPVHFAQALGELTHDHHSAIGQGLGMDGKAVSVTESSRGLGGGADAGGVSVGAGKTLTLLGLTDVGDAEDTAASCGGSASAMMATVVQWHLIFLLVAFCHLHCAVAATSAAAANARSRNRRTGKKSSERTSFWGLRAGDHIAMRLRTALGVLAVFCAVTTALGAELGERGGFALLGLHAHPAWGECATTAGLDGSWGVVSPLLVFAMLAAAAGVYIRAGSLAPVRIGAGLALLFFGLVVWIAVGRAYLVLAIVAGGLDWAAWGVAGVLSCVCYQHALLPKLERDSSGSTACVDDTGSGLGGGHHHRAASSSGARHRNQDGRRFAAGGGSGGSGAIARRGIGKGGD